MAAIPTILKGDTPAAIPIALAEGYDYSNAVLHVRYKGVEKAFTGLVGGSSLALQFTADETARFSLGAAQIGMWLVYPGGEIRTIPTDNVRIKVTDAASEVYNAAISLVPGSSLPADATDGDSLGDLKLKFNQLKAAIGAACLLACLALPAATARLNDLPGTNYVVTAETDPRAAGIVSGIVTRAYVEGLGITSGEGGIAEETDPTVPAWSKAPAPPVDTNDVENIVTKEEVVGFTPWTARNLPSGVSLIGQPSFYPYSNEWYWDSSGGIAGVFVCYASSEDATELRFKELDELTDGFTATREPITRNALGLARMEDLPPLTNGIPEAISSQQAQVSQLSQTSDELWNFLMAENFRVTITNYDSTAHTPEASFEYRMGTNEAFRVVWSETNGLTRTHTAATNDAIRTAKAEMAKPENRAWGRYDATTGAPAPEGIVQVSAEGGLMIGGGMGYTSVAASGGEYWVLSSTDPTLCRTGTNGVFQIIDAYGNAAVTVRKGDKRLVPAPAGGIVAAGGNVVIPYNIESAEHPLIECSATLDAGGTWHEAGADGAPFGAAVWTGSSGAWVATIPEGTASTGFFRASYWAGGGTVVSYGSAAMEMQRVKIGNVEYAVGTATIDGHTVLTLEVAP